MRFKEYYLKESIESQEQMNKLHLTYKGNGIYKDNQNNSFTWNKQNKKFDKNNIESNKVKITDTENFKKWFGDSKVVDEKGNPLVVYHGSDSIFNTFVNGNNKRSNVNAYFFTENKDVASDYGKNIMSCYLSMKESITLDFEDKSTIYFDGKYRTPSDLVKRIIEINNDLKNRYGLNDELKDELESDFGWSSMWYDKIDGLILKNINDTADFGKESKITNHYVIFDPNQIKSAIGNNGNFNIKSDNINEDFFKMIEVPNGSKSYTEDKYFDIFKNPRQSELYELFDISYDKGLRIGMDMAGNFYVWPDFILHSDCEKLLGINFKLKLEYTQNKDIIYLSSAELIDSTEKLKKVLDKVKIYRLKNIFDKVKRIEMSRKPYKVLMEI